jgi:hypothetical protein
MTPLAFALIAGAILLRKRRRRRAHESLGREATLADDPRDPVQSLHERDELEVVQLDVDALPRVDVAAMRDLLGVQLEIEEEAEDAERRVDDAVDVDQVAAIDDAGDLYGVHTPRAVDREHPDDDRAFDEGQNWVEALETSATENGPEPEHALDDIVDDADLLRAPHASDRRDRPVADKGSGGVRGL